MKACVVCVDEDVARSRVRRKVLENAGFAVLSASHETRAVELLQWHRVDVACVTSQRDVQARGLGRAIKRARPDVPVVLIHDRGEIPAHFEEYVDIVLDESDFEMTAQWLIEELQDAEGFFFVRWFVDWMRRPSERKTGEPFPTC